MFYYELHVMEDRKNGFSIPIKSELNLNTIEVIKLALSLELIDNEDGKSVDYVKKIDELDYKLIGGE